MADGNKIQKEHFYIFLDTNTLMNQTNSWDIFTTDLLRNVLVLRDFIERDFSIFKEIKIILPELVLKERYKQKYKKLEPSIATVIDLLEDIYEGNNAYREVYPPIRTVKENLYSIIEQKGEEYLSKNRIEVTRPCDSRHFSRITAKVIQNEAPFEENSDKGYKDTLIWFSIIDYVQENVKEASSKILLITHNLRQFDAPRLHEEFKEYTGYEIICVGFDGGKSNIDITHPEFSKVLEHVLRTNQSDMLKKIRISYFRRHDEAIIEGFWAEPLPINLSALFSGSRLIPYDSSQNNRIRENALGILKNLGFDTELIKKDVKVFEIKPAEVSVSLRDYKKQFLDFLDLNIRFDDDTEISIDYPDVQFNILEYYETPEYFQYSESKHIIQYLEELGYKDLDSSMVNFQVVSSVRDDWD
jgi:hypothetical protein